MAATHLLPAVGAVGRVAEGVAGQRGQAAGAAVVRRARERAQRRRLVLRANPLPARTLQRAASMVMMRLPTYHAIIFACVSTESGMVCVIFNQTSESLSPFMLALESNHPSDLAIVIP